MGAARADINYRPSCFDGVSAAEADLRGPIESHIGKQAAVPRYITTWASLVRGGLGCSFCVEARLCPPLPPQVRIPCMLLRLPHHSHVNEPHHPAASSTRLDRPQRFGQMELYQRGETVIWRTCEWPQWHPTPEPQSFQLGGAMRMQGRDAQSGDAEIRQSSSPGRHGWPARAPHTAHNSRPGRQDWSAQSSTGWVASILSSLRSRSNCNHSV